MANHKPKKRKKIGLPPGSVIFTGNRKVDKIIIHYLQYNETQLEEQQLDNQSIQGFHQPIDQFVQWYDFRGLHDTLLIEEIGKTFKVHPLALEDIADINQRPKVDEYNNGIFVTLKAITFDRREKVIRTEQVALYLGSGFVLSFQENETDLLLNIRNRLQKSAGRIRKRGADYLMYAILDSIVDQYYLLLDDVEEEIEGLEKSIIENHNPEIRSRLYHLKQEMLKLRKVVIPVRELIHQLTKSENELIVETTEFYLRDLRDHVMQTIDLIEASRDNLNSLQELFLSELSHRMNSVMNLLTIIASIFIPLTFLAGIYGMNFEYMPELKWKYSYFVLLTIMLILALLMVWYFRRKRWL